MTTWVLFTLMQIYSWEFSKVKRLISNTDVNITKLLNKKKSIFILNIMKCPSLFWQKYGICRCARAWSRGSMIVSADKSLLTIEFMDKFEVNRHKRSFNYENHICSFIHITSWWKLSTSWNKKLSYVWIYSSSLLQYDSPIIVKLLDYKMEAIHIRYE